MAGFGVPMVVLSSAALRESDRQAGLAPHGPHQRPVVYPRCYMNLTKLENDHIRVTAKII
jgi:hypothetical protein